MYNRTEIQSIMDLKWRQAFIANFIQIFFSFFFALNDWKMSFKRHCFKIESGGMIRKKMTNERNRNGGIYKRFNIKQL